jgi:glycosyltransferase involved in cell wall biosynthesis/ubiquinone/menaquinone biosynthesis C-methylase UbiE
METHQDPRERSLDRPEDGGTVSIIIPTYNHARYLDDAIQSAWNQTIQPAEVIVVDDGSTDHPEEVASRYPGTICLRQDNRGLSAARNTGALHSKSDFLVFLDADDLLYPDALARNLRHFRRRPECVFISGGYDLVNAQKELLEKKDTPAPLKDHYIALLAGNYIGMHATVMYRREVFDRYLYDETLCACEDYDLYLRLARDHPVFAHDEKLAAYRRHGSNMSADLWLMHRQVKAVLRKAAALAKSPEVLAACRRGGKNWKDFYARQAFQRMTFGSARPQGQPASRDLLLALTSRAMIGPLALRGLKKCLRLLARIYSACLEQAKRLSRRSLRYRVPHTGRLHLGDLRRTTPFRSAGDGIPLDQWYVKTFLAENEPFLTGRVLAIGDLWTGDVMMQTGSLRLAAAFTGNQETEHLPPETFDCIILTQSLQFVYDLGAALAECHRLLKQGGTLLLAVPGIAPENGKEGIRLWSFTPAVVCKMLEPLFGTRATAVRARGNVLTATAFLYGLGAGELTQREKLRTDPHYPVVITATAIKNKSTAKKTQERKSLAVEAKDRQTAAGDRLPLVSVVITTYNHACYLTDAVESVLAQTHRKTELLIVDDGSTDHTSEVVKAWPRAKYIRQQNKGLSAARNTGARYATGEFIVFLDADDLLYPDALAVNLKYFALHPSCGFVSGGHDMVDEEKRKLEAPDWQVFPEKDHFLALLRCDYISMHGAVMYRREVFSNCRYDEQLRACEDYDLYLQVAARYPVFSHGEKVAAYRKHDKSMSSDSTLMYASALEVLSKYDRRRYGSAVRQACSQGRKDLQRHYGPGAGTSRASLRMKIKRGDGGRGARSAATRHLRLGDLRRLTPFSTCFGYDRGGPVDRPYIESFLAGHAGAIRGRVLEIGDNAYTLAYGGEHVTRSDVLHVDLSHPGATFGGDLSHADHIPSDAFDCIILTQTLHLIYDFRAALAHCHRMLKPGGTLLATVPGISQTDYGEWGDTWYWSFTPAAMSRMLQEHFAVQSVDIRSHGNVLVATAFLYGMGAGELSEAERQQNDLRYPVIVTAAATKSAAP